MVATFFLKGLIIGFSIAAPVGPIGVLCIRRSLEHGTRAGLTVGLGAATADALYGCVAAFGLTAISTLLVGYKLILALMGGAFLCYLGIRTLLSKPASSSANTKQRDLIGSYVSTLFLTLTNPATILSFVAIFAGFGLGAAPDYSAAASLVVGVFVGSALWWVLLSNVVGLLRAHVTTRWMQWINRFSGGLLLAFGIYALIQAFPR